MAGLYSESDVPSQAGRTVFVTGANTGIGFDTARVLAANGARVLLGCRSRDKGDAACESICALHANADVEYVPLDLGSLASVQAAAEVVAKEPQLDLLINNAGIMMPPKSLTEDGFESQFGVNHLGHFALTAHLLGKLRDQPGARVVTVSSAAHRFGFMDWQDIHSERYYNPQSRYAMSKLANLLFTLELQRRLKSVDAAAIAVACHPGIADTELSRNLPPLVASMMMPMMRPFVNTSAEGALPTLRAATDHEAAGADYFGPEQMFEWAHGATKVRASMQARSATDAARLWELSSELTGVVTEI